MVKALVVATILWPLLLASAVVFRLDGRAPVWTAMIYFAGAQVCHQKPERSFQTAGVPWPVCARCSGLYLSAPIGALAAVLIARRRRAVPRPWWLVVAAVPTAVTIGLEWPHLAPVSNAARMLAALPLGVAVALAIVIVASGRREPIEYTGGP